MRNEHIYRVNASSTIARSGIATAEEIQPSIIFSAPPEFRGQAGHWTPEHLFVAGVASCYVSTFSGMADVSKFEFLSLNLEAEAILGKDEKGWRFTQVVLRPRLKIAQDTDRERANRLLHKAEEACLVARSLNCLITLEPEVAIEEEMLESEKMGESIPIT
jgi:organic hydroperoxide reductase OsmC/OhrA